MPREFTFNFGQTRQLFAGRCRDLRWLVTLSFYLGWVLNCQGNVTLTSTVVCYGDSTKLVNTTNLPGTASVLWDLNNDGFYNDASGNTVEYIFTGGTTFSVSLEIIDSSGNRYYSDSPVVVKVHPRPSVDFAWAGICSGYSTRYVDLSYISDSGALSYLWDFNSGSVANSTVAAPVCQYLTGGNYTTKLWVTSAHGCVDSLQKSVMIYPTPVASFIYGDTCQGSQAQFVNTSQISGDTLDRVLWNFGNGNQAFTADTVFQRYLNSGNYVVSLQIQDTHGCHDSVSATIQVLPAVSFDYSFSNDSVILPGKSTIITVTGNFTSIAWEDGSTASSKTISDSGNYSFTMSNGSGCFEIHNIHISYLTPSTENILRANDFLTPNGDGVNDLLVFKNIENYGSCSLKIYDAAGLEVYSTTNYHNDWDGKKNGKLLNAGSFYYVIRCDALPQVTGVTNIIH